MAQADLNVANQSGAAFRADLNNQLLALGTLQSGNSAPSTTYQGMLWLDTSTSPSTIKQRNDANNGWVTLGTLSTNFGLFTNDVNLSSTGYLDIPSGTTAQRPGSPNSGMIRYNTTLGIFEGYTTEWGRISTGPLTEMGSQTSAGTNNVFSSIPSWAKKITVVFDAISLSGSANLLLQLGTSAAIESSSYASNCATVQSSATVITTDTFGIVTRLAGTSNYASGIIDLIKIYGNFWIAKGAVRHFGASDFVSTVTGQKNLSGAIGQLRLISSNGTDTFKSSGAFNVFYEG